MPDPIDSLVGRKIGQRRKEVGLSRRALGERIGIGLKQVNKYETAANRVSAGRLFDIAGVLGVPPTYFFEGAGENGLDGRAGGVEALSEPGVGLHREMGTLVDSYHTLPRDIRKRFLRLVRAIADDV